MDAHKKSKVSIMVLPEAKENSMTKSIDAFRRHGSVSRMKLRKQSYGYSGVPGIKPVDRASQSGTEFKRPVLLFLNTYQLEPHIPFHPEKVLKAANQLLDDLFTEHKYNVQDSPALAMRIAGDLMRQVKTMNFNRYRIISVVTIAEKRAQSYNNAITFLWDHERDGYINLQREVNTAFIQVTLFGIYLD